MFERWYFRYLTVATVVAIPVALYVIVADREYASGSLLLFMAATGLVLEWRGKAARQHGDSPASANDSKGPRHQREVVSLVAWVAWAALCIAVFVYAVSRKMNA